MLQNAAWDVTSDEISIFITLLITFEVKLFHIP